MNIFDLLVRIITFVNLAVYLYVIVQAFRKRKISKAHNRFFWLILASALWILVVFVQDEIHYLPLYVHFAHIDFALAAIIAGLVPAFAVHFPKEEKKFTPRREILFFLPLIIFSLLSFDPSVNGYAEYRVPSGSPGYLPYFLTLTIYFVVIGGCTLFIRFRQSIGIRRQQLRLILIGYFISIFAMLADSAFNFYINVVPLVVDRYILNISVAFSFFSAYAMLRYRFLDVKLALRRGLVHAIVFGSIIAILTLFVWGLWQYTQPSSNNQFALIAAFIILIGFVFDPLRRIVIRWTNRVFFVKEYERRRIARSFRETTSVSLEEFEQRIVSSVSKYLEGAHSQLLVRSNNHWKNSNGKDIDVGFSPTELIEVEPERNILVRDEIEFFFEEGRGESVQLNVLRTALDQHHFAAIVPIRGSSEQVIGAILVGPKKSKEAFTVEDLDFLRSLGRGASMVVENVRMYSNILQQLRSRLPNNS